MTLHWWMHWFWVTLRLSVVLSSPLPSTTLAELEGSYRPSTIRETTASIADESVLTTPVSLPYTVSTGDEKEEVVQDTMFGAETSSKLQNYRVAKAIAAGSDPPGPTSPTTSSYPNVSAVNISPAINENIRKSNSSVLESARLKDDNETQWSGPNAVVKNRTDAATTRSDSKVTWIFTANKTARTIKLTEGKLKVNVTPGFGKKNDTSKPLLSHEEDERGEEVEDLAVLPLHEPTPTRFKLVLNRTKFIPSTNINDKLFGQTADIELRERVQPRVLATSASILQGISESPRLSRARSAFPADYQQDQEKRQERQHEKPSDKFDNVTSSTAVDIAAVTGSCLATLVLLGTMGSLGFVMYRRRYMNPPQTLNSDKCSNPDSSGYIDDSTIRDNSEEMYSLDNDSFLNSLEAMTIQNYWTDSVKHTKL